MSTTIHPYLIARFMAVQEAFGQPGFRPIMATNMAAPVAPPKKSNNWKEVLKDEDKGDEGEGGGGGTMKGLRGKQAEYAKQAMRKLTRR